ncbi:MAG: DUF262 domain-containing protein [Deltaproteobacteria bacterium]|nr:DUF262 domain-containing protein [Deltaproteobacteria bacterium]
MIRHDPRPYSINDFWEWNQRKELVLTPKFQRRTVWSDKARSYLIDTILRGLPIPKIFMRHDIDPRTRKSIREIVDGQQRLRTILSYLEDGFKVDKVHNEEFAKYYFSQLPERIQKEFLSYPISVDVLQGAKDAQVLDIFARLNTYTVTLNRQEKLNAKYFGVFKQTVYSLGYEYLNFWTNNKILSNRDVTRMGEAELTSELVILIIDGIQDRKRVEEYYKKYDDEFENREEVLRQFRRTMDTISEILGGTLESSEFASKPLFYSLFGVIHELLKEDRIQKKDYAKIGTALADIDSILSSEPDDLSLGDFKFFDASTKHVTDAAARRIRHDFIKKRILEKIGI